MAFDLVESIQRLLGKPIDVVQSGLRELIRELQAREGFEMDAARFGHPEPQLPHILSLEEKLCQSLLWSPRACDAVLDELPVEAFTDVAAAEVYVAIQRAYDKVGDSLQLIDLAEFLELPDSRFLANQLISVTHPALILFLEEHDMLPNPLVYARQITAAWGDRDDPDEDGYAAELESEME